MAVLSNNSNYRSKEWVYVYMQEVLPALKDVYAASHQSYMLLAISEK